MKKALSMFCLLIMLSTIIPMAVFTSSAASSSVVPSGAKEYNGHTYYVFKSTKSWSSAKSYCESLGGHLVTITSSKENKFVASLIDKSKLKYIWLGATDKDKEGTWKWVTGEKFKYKAWDSNQPDNSTSNDANGEDYLQTWSTSSKWNDSINSHSKGASSRQQGFVCEWDMSKKAASALRMAKTTASVTYGKTTTLKVLNASGTVKWKSSDTKIATVSSKGVVTGKALGSCTISATVGKKTVKCKVTVKDANSKATVSMKINGGGYFIKGESTAKVTFKLKDNSCAKVTVYIRNASGDSVYKKTYKTVKKGTSYSFNWNGKNADGAYVSTGSYRVQVVAGTKKSYSSYIKFTAKNEFADGNGSKDNPFCVATTSQFNKIIKYPAAYFKQTKDLDFDYNATGNFFTKDQPFNGVYDGGNKTLKNISANNPVFNITGKDAVIKNVNTQNCNVIAQYGAILVRENYGKISNCKINGIISGTFVNSAYMGLIASINYGRIADCETSGSISGVTTEYGGTETVVGGIAGVNKSEGKIINCITEASLSAQSANYPYTGGITGHNNGLITDCEASGLMTVTKTNGFGGEVTMGGISAYNSGTITNSYYTGESVVDIVGRNDGAIA